MTLDPQLVALLQTLGPPLLAIAAAVLTMLGSVVAFLARFAWKTQQGKMDGLAAQITEIATSIATNRARAQVERENVNETIQGLREDVDRALQAGGSVEGRVAELTDTVKKQGCGLSKMMRELGEVTGRLEGMFQSVRHSTL